jgi:hypothetical protein
VILAYAVIFLIVLALLLRRDLSAIGRISYKGSWKLAVVVVILFVLHDALVIYTSGQTIFQIAILISSQVALMCLLLLNHHIPGTKLFVLGLIFNTTVMVVNGGWMPVTPETYRFVHPDQTIEIQTRPSYSKNVILPHTQTRLWILSDIIHVPLPWHRYAVSIGDLLLVIGVAQFIFQTTARRAARDRAPAGEGI